MSGRVEVNHVVILMLPTIPFPRSSNRFLSGNLETGMLFGWSMAGVDFNSTAEYSFNGLINEVCGKVCESAADR